MPRLECDHTVHGYSRPKISAVRFLLSCLLWLNDTFFRKKWKALCLHWLTVTQNVLSSTILLLHGKETSNNSSKFFLLLLQKSNLIIVIFKKLRQQVNVYTKLIIRKNSATLDILWSVCRCPLLWSPVLPNVLNVCSSVGGPTWDMYVYSRQCECITVDNIQRSKYVTVRAIVQL